MIKAIPTRFKNAITRINPSSEYARFRSFGEKKYDYSADDIEHDLGQFTRPDEPESLTSYLSTSISDSSALYSLSLICRYLRVIRALSEMPRGVSW